MLTISNYVTINMLDELKRVPGVGDAINFIARDYSMRVWLQHRADGAARRDADRRRRPRSRAQNNQYAAGKIGAEPAPTDQRSPTR